MAAFEPKPVPIEWILYWLPAMHELCREIGMWDEPPPAEEEG